jgi:ubiquinone/menaquinone biosynthesis C-methylase UbiE
MEKEKRPYVCPAEYAGSLDNPLRKLIHNPRKILEPYITKGMTVIDFGCGPGYFTTGLANLVGDGGKVIAADLQQAMLDKVIRKIRGTGLEKRITLHNCQKDWIGITEKADFVLAFWMVHEVPDQQSMFREFKSLLNPGGKILIIEPKFHVTKESFRKTISQAESEGFEIVERPKVRFSRTALISVKKNQ